MIYFLEGGVTFNPILCLDMLLICGEFLGRLVNLNFLSNSFRTTMSVTSFCS